MHWNPMENILLYQVWDEYCRRCGVPEDGKWFDTVMAYERDVQMKRV